MALVFRFRLYPNKKQKERMICAIETCRRLWNLALADRKEAWEYNRLSTTYADQSRMLTAEKQTDISLTSVYSQVLQDVLRRLDRAFQAFFEHRAKYPRFKKFSLSGSFTYPQAYNGPVKPDLRGKRLYLSKVGNVKAVFHRVTPEAKIKACTVKREPDGTWYASLVYDEIQASLREAKVPAPLKSPIGVDLGLMAIVTTSDGKKVKPPRFFRKAEGRLRRLQKKLSSTKKGSRNRERARCLLAAQHTKVARRRNDFNHKLSTTLTKKHDLLAFEDLSVKGMASNHVVAKSIADAGWAQLLSFAEYKAARKGKFLTKVPAPDSTRECWFCGTLNQASLDVREFNCAGCERLLDRDINAARIILKRAIAKVGQDKAPLEPRPESESHSRVVPELKPVETGPPPSQSTGKASSVGEAGTTCSGIQTSPSESRCWKPPVSDRRRMSLPDLDLYGGDVAHSAGNGALDLLRVDGDGLHLDVCGEPLRQHLGDIDRA